MPPFPLPYAGVDHSEILHGHYAYAGGLSVKNMSSNWKFIFIPYAIEDVLSDSE